MHISITGSLFPFTHTHSHTPHIHTHTLIYFICCVRRVSCYEEIYAQNEKVELLLHTSHLQSGSRGERAAEGNAAPEAVCGPDAVQDLSKTNWRLPVSYLLLDWSAVTIVVTAQHQSIWQKLLDCAVLWLSIDENHSPPYWWKPRPLQTKVTRFLCERRRLTTHIRVRSHIQYKRESRGSKTDHLVSKGVWF